MNVKTIIDTASTDENQPYAHLIPLVQFICKNGNYFSPPVGKSIPNEFGFYQDKDGWKCDFFNPIDFNLVQNNFIFPSTISLNPGSQSIFCRNSWIGIRGNIR